MRQYIEAVKNPYRLHNLILCLVFSCLSCQSMLDSTSIKRKPKSVSFSGPEMCRRIIRATLYQRRRNTHTFSIAELDPECVCAPIMKDNFKYLNCWLNIYFRIDSGIGAWNLWHPNHRYNVIFLSFQICTDCSSCLQSLACKIKIKDVRKRDLQLYSKCYCVASVI
jgi:hypothetical protein